MRRAFAPAKADALDGLTLGEITPGARGKLRLPDGLRAGALVVEVEPGGAAARSGMRASDVVLEVNREKLAGVERFPQAYPKGPRADSAAHLPGRSHAFPGGSPLNETQARIAAPKRASRS
ncbi:MAG: PDZ domain-containing protein [Myxococcales bacterium]|nr:PDZ domain-containing protein [Myxococcales bacterium]